MSSFGREPAPGTECPRAPKKLAMLSIELPPPAGLPAAGRVPENRFCAYFAAGPDPDPEVPVGESVDGDEG